MISALLIPKTHWDLMRAHVNRESPLEACGLCAGKNDTVEKIFEVMNQAESSLRFVMNPHQQLRAFEQIDSDQMDLLAIYHSHPAGPEVVSATDIAEAAYEVVHIVWSRQAEKWRARGFWIKGQIVSEVRLTVI